MGRYGDYGRPIALLEAYISWRDQRLGAAEAGVLEEADTKADFASFLFGPIATSMWHGYERVQNNYRRYARVESVRDFRQRRLRGLTGMTKPGYVGDHGEYAALTRGERPPATLVIDTYGGVYSITRHAIINDESGELLSSAPTEMGDSAGEFIIETIIALIESNPTAPDGNPFFSSGRGNQQTALLSEQSLAIGIAAMTKQLDDTGRRIVVRPAALVVNDPLQQLVANRIINSQEAGTNVNYTGGTAGIGTQYFDKGTSNPIAGILPSNAVVYDPYFTDVTNNDWYLFADPARVPAFAVGFLNGKEEPFLGLKSPEVRNALGPGTDPYTYELDSVDFKVRLDFGVAPVDPRGAYRSVVA